MAAIINGLTRGIRCLAGCLCRRTRASNQDEQRVLTVAQRNLVTLKALADARFDARVAHAEAQENRKSVRRIEDSIGSLNDELRNASPNHAWGLRGTQRLEQSALNSLDPYRDVGQREADAYDRLARCEARFKNHLLQSFPIKEHTYVTQGDYYGYSVKPGAQISKETLESLVKGTFNPNDPALIEEIERSAI